GWPTTGPWPSSSEPAARDRVAHAGLRRSACGLWGNSKDLLRRLASLRYGINSRRRTAPVRRRDLPQHTNRKHVPHARDALRDLPMSDAPASRKSCARRLAPACLYFSLHLTTKYKRTRACRRAWFDAVTACGTPDMACGTPDIVCRFRPSAFTLPESQRLGTSPCL